MTRDKGHPFVPHSFLVDYETVYESCTVMGKHARYFVKTGEVKLINPPPSGPKLKQQIIMKIGDSEITSDLYVGSAGDLCVNPSQCKLIERALVKYYAKIRKVGNVKW